MVRRYTEIMKTISVSSYFIPIQGPFSFLFRFFFFVSDNFVYLRLLLFLTFSRWLLVFLLWSMSAQFHSISLTQKLGENQSNECKRFFFATYDSEFRQSNLLYLYAFHSKSIKPMPSPIHHFNTTHNDNDNKEEKFPHTVYTVGNPFPLALFH